MVVNCLRRSLILACDISSSYLPLQSGMDYLSMQDFAMLLKTHLSVLPPIDCKCTKFICETADFIYVANVRVVVAGAAAGGTGV